MIDNQTQKFATALAPDGFLEFMFGGQFPPVPTPKPTMPEVPEEDVLERLHRQIAESAKKHSAAIRCDHERSMKEMHRRHDFRLQSFVTSFVTSGRVDGTIGLSSSATFSTFYHVRVLGQELFRIPSGKANPTVDDFYINVPLILKLWFRQTTPGCFVRWIMRGFK